MNDLQQIRDALEHYATNVIDPLDIGIPVSQGGVVEIVDNTRIAKEAIATLDRMMAAQPAESVGNILRDMTFLLFEKIDGMTERKAFEISELIMSQYSLSQPKQPDVNVFHGKCAKCGNEIYIKNGFTKQPDVNAELLEALKKIMLHLPSPPKDVYWFAMNAIARAEQKGGENVS